MPDLKILHHLYVNNTAFVAGPASARPKRNSLPLKAVRGNRTLRPRGNFLFQPLQMPRIPTLGPRRCLSSIPEIGAAIQLPAPRTARTVNRAHLFAFTFVQAFG